MNILSRLFDLSPIGFLIGIFIWQGFNFMENKDLPLHSRILGWAITVTFIVLAIGSVIVFYRDVVF